MQLLEVRKHRIFSPKINEKRVLQSKQLMVSLTETERHERRFN